MARERMRVRIPYKPSVVKRSTNDHPVGVHLACGQHNNYRFTVFLIRFIATNQ